MKFIRTFESFVNEARKSASELEDHLDELNSELKDLKRELKGLFADQDAEAGEKGDKWNDDDGNRYGKMMNDVEDKITSKKEEIKKVETQLHNLTKPRGPREVTEEDVIKRSLKFHLEDIQKSQKSWPDRTPEEQATIYKKRYGIKDTIEKIVAAMKELKIIE